MKTIEIISEIEQKETLYRAICGQQEATGKTPGQALDLIVNQEHHNLNHTIVILQGFSDDQLFTLSQQNQLKNLMTEFHQNLANEIQFSPEKHQELESLVNSELEATIERSQQILNEFNLSQQ